MIDSTTVETVGAFSAIVLGFLGVAKIMLAQGTKERDADRTERIKLSDAISTMAQNSSKQAEATKAGFNKLVRSNDRAADEAKERNGHLAELVLQGTESTKVIAEGAVTTIVAAVSSAQNIKEQTVEHAHIEHAEIKK